MTLVYSRRPSIRTLRRPIDVTVTLARALALISVAAGAGLSSYGYVVRPAGPTPVMGLLVPLMIAGALAAAVWGLALGVRATRLWAAIGLIVLGGLLATYTLMIASGTAFQFDRRDDSPWTAVALGLSAIALLDLALLLPFAVLSIQSMAALRAAQREFPGPALPPPLPAAVAGPRPPAVDPSSAALPARTLLPALPDGSDPRRPVARAVLAARVLGVVSLLAAASVAVAAQALYERQAERMSGSGGAPVMIPGTVGLVLYATPGVFLLVVAGQLKALRRRAAARLIALGCGSAVFGVFVAYLTGAPLLHRFPGDAAARTAYTVLLAFATAQLASAVPLIVYAARSAAAVAVLREAGAGRLSGAGAATTEPGLVGPVPVGPTPFKRVHAAQASEN
jgi:hypothetical protein